MAKIKLHTSEHGAVSLVTQKANEDIEIILPDEDGGLVTADNASVNIVKNNISIGYILKPKGLVNPIENPGAFDGELIVRPYETTENFKGKHTETLWEVSLQEDFSEILITHSETDPNKLLKFRADIEDRNRKLYLRYKFISGNIMSVWSDTIFYITPTGRIGKPDITVTNEEYGVSISTGDIKILGNLFDIYLKRTHWIIREIPTNAIVYELDTTDLDKLKNIKLSNINLLNKRTYEVEVTHYSNKYGIYSLPSKKIFKTEFSNIEIRRLEYDKKTNNISVSVYANNDMIRDIEWNIFGISSEAEEHLLVKYNAEDDEKNKYKDKTKDYIFNLSSILGKTGLKNSIYNEFLIKCQILGAEGNSPIKTLTIRKDDLPNAIEIYSNEFLYILNKYFLPQLRIKLQVNEDINIQTGTIANNDIDLIKSNVVNTFKLKLKNHDELYDIKKYCRLRAYVKADNDRLIPDLNFNSYIFDIELDITPTVLSALNNFNIDKNITPVGIKDDSLEPLDKLLINYFVKTKSGLIEKTFEVSLTDTKLFNNKFKVYDQFTNPKIKINRLDFGNIDLEIQKGEVKNQSWTKVNKIVLSINDKKTGYSVATVEKDIETKDQNNKYFNFNLNNENLTNLKSNNEYTITASVYTSWLMFTSEYVEFSYPVKTIDAPIINIEGQGKTQTVTLTNSSDSETYILKVYDENNSQIFVNENTKFVNNKYQLPWNIFEVNKDYVVGVTRKVNDLTSPETRFKIRIDNVTTSFGEFIPYINGVVNYLKPQGKITGYNVIGDSGEGTELKYADIEVYENKKLIGKTKIENIVNNKDFTFAGNSLNIPLQAETAYAVKVRVGNEKYNPTEWKTYNFKTSKKLIETVDGLEDLVYGTWENGGIFGSVDRKFIAPTSSEFGDQIALREYCGEWGDESQFRNVNVREYYWPLEKLTEENKSLTTKLNSIHTTEGENLNNYNQYGLGYDEPFRIRNDDYRYHWDYKTGDRVSYKGKLYEAIMDQKFGQYNPSTSTLAWREITKDLLLPSEVELLDNMGINWNVNTTTLPSDESFTVSDQLALKGSISDVNRQAGWTKILSPTTKKVCYISTLNFIDKLAFNDIMSRQKEYGILDKYTLRFGTRLYYVRIPTFEELDILDQYEKGLKDGSILSKDTAAYTINADHSTFILSRNDVQHDILSNDKALITSVGVDKIVNHTTAQKNSRTLAGLRVVITPIEEKDEPHLMLNKALKNPKIKQAYFKYYKYDKFTDCGFIGIADDLFSRDALLLQSGLLPISNNIIPKLQVGQIGQSYDNGKRWIIRYRHGLVICEPIGPITNNLNMNNIFNLGIVYGYNIANTPSKVFTNNLQYYTPETYSIETGTYLRRNNINFSKNTDGFTFRNNSKVTRKFTAIAKSDYTELLRCISAMANPKKYLAEHVDHNELMYKLVGISWTISYDDPLMTAKNYYWFNSSYTTIGKHYSYYNTNDEIIIDYKDFYQDVHWRYLYKTLAPAGTVSLGHHIITKDTGYNEKSITYADIDCAASIPRWNLAYNNGTTIWQPLLVANIELNKDKMSPEDTTIHKWFEESSTSGLKVNINEQNTMKEDTLINLLRSKINKIIDIPEVKDLFKSLTKDTMDYIFYSRSRYPFYIDSRLKELAETSSVLIVSKLPNYHSDLCFCYTSQAHILYNELENYGLDHQKYLLQVIWIDDCDLLYVKNDPREILIMNENWRHQDLTKYKLEDKILIQKLIEILYDGDKLRLISETQGYKLFRNHPFSLEPDMNYIHCSPFKYSNIPTETNHACFAYEFEAKNGLVNKRLAINNIDVYRDYYDHQHELETPDYFGLYHRFIHVGVLDRFFVYIKKHFTKPNYDQIIKNIRPEMSNLFDTLYDIKKLEKILLSMTIVGISLKTSTNLYIIKNAHLLDSTIVPNTRFFNNSEWNVNGIPVAGYMMYYWRMLGQHSTHINYPEEIPGDFHDEPKMVKYNKLLSNLTSSTKGFRNGRLFLDNKLAVEVSKGLNNVDGINNVKPFVSYYLTELEDSDGTYNGNIKPQRLSYEQKQNFGEQLNIINKIATEILENGRSYGCLTSSSKGDKYNRMTIFLFTDKAQIIDAYYYIRHNAHNYINVAGIQEYLNSVTDVIEDRIELLIMALYDHILRYSIVIWTNNHKPDLAHKKILSSDYLNLEEHDPYPNFYGDYRLLSDIEYSVQDANTDFSQWEHFALTEHTYLNDNMPNIYKYFYFDNYIKVEPTVENKYLDYNVIKNDLNRTWYYTKNANKIYNLINNNLKTTEVVSNPVYVFDKGIYDNNQYYSWQYIWLNKQYPYRKPVLIDLKQVPASYINFKIKSNNIVTLNTENKLALETNSNKQILQNIPKENITWYTAKQLTSYATAFTYLTNINLNNMHTPNKDSVAQNRDTMDIPFNYYRVITNLGDSLIQFKDDDRYYNSVYNQSIHGDLLIFSLFCNNPDPNWNMGNIFKFNKGYLFNYSHSFTKTNNIIISLYNADDFLWFLEDIIKYRDEYKAKFSTDTSGVKKWAKVDIRKHIVAYVLNRDINQLDGLSKNKFKDYIDSVFWYDSNGQYVDKYYKNNYMPDDTWYSYVNVRDYKYYLVKINDNVIDSSGQKSLGTKLKDKIGNLSNYVTSRVYSIVLNNINFSTTPQSWLGAHIHLPIATDSTNKQKIYNMLFSRDIEDSLIMSNRKLFDLAKLHYVDIDNIRLIFADIKYIEDLVYFITKKFGYHSCNGLSYIIWYNPDKYNNNLSITELLGYQHSKLQIGANKYIRRPEIRLYGYEPGYLQFYGPNLNIFEGYKIPDEWINKYMPNYVYTNGNNKETNYPNEITVDEDFKSKYYLEGSCFNSFYSKSSNPIPILHSENEGRETNENPYFINTCLDWDNEGNWRSFNKRFIEDYNINKALTALYLYYKKAGSEVNFPRVFDNMIVHKNYSNEKMMLEYDDMHMENVVFDYTEFKFCTLQELIDLRINYIFLPNIVSDTTGVKFEETVNNTGYTTQEDIPNLKYFADHGKKLAEAFKQLMNNNPSIKRISINGKNNFYNIGGIDNFFNTISWNFIKQIENIEDLKWLEEFRSTAVVKTSDGKIVMGALKRSEILNYYNFIKDKIGETYNMYNNQELIKVLYASLLLQKVLIIVDEPDGTDKELQKIKNRLMTIKADFDIIGRGVTQTIKLTSDTVTAAKENDWLNFTVKLYNSEGNVIHNEKIAIDQSAPRTVAKLPYYNIERKVNQRVEVSIETRYKTFETVTKFLNNDTYYNIGNITFASPNKTWLCSEDLYVTITGTEIINRAENNLSFTDMHMDVSNVYYEVWDKDKNTKLYSEIVVNQFISTSSGGGNAYTLKNIKFKINPAANIKYNQNLILKFKFRTEGYGYIEMQQKEFNRTMTNSDHTALTDLNTWAKTSHAHPLDLEKDFKSNFEKYFGINNLQVLGTYTENTDLGYYLDSVREKWITEQHLIAYNAYTDYYITYNASLVKFNYSRVIKGIKFHNAKIGYNSAYNYEEFKKNYSSYDFTNFIDVLNKGIFIEEITSSHSVIPGQTIYYYLITVSNDKYYGYWEPFLDKPMYNTSNFSIIKNIDTNAKVIPDFMHSEINNNYPHYITKGITNYWGYFRTTRILNNKFVKEENPNISIDLPVLTIDENGTTDNTNGEGTGDFLTHGEIVIIHRFSTEKIAEQASRPTKGYYWIPSKGSFIHKNSLTNNYTYTIQCMFAHNKTQNNWYQTCRMPTDEWELQNVYLFNKHRNITNIPLIDQRKFIPLSKAYQYANNNIANVKSTSYGIYENNNLTNIVSPIYGSHKQAILTYIYNIINIKKLSYDPKKQIYYVHSCNYVDNYIIANIFPEIDYKPICDCNNTINRDHDFTNYDIFILATSEDTEILECIEEVKAFIKKITITDDIYLRIAEFDSATVLKIKDSEIRRINIETF